MALPITIPNTFATETSNIPLSELDTNFTTVASAINGIGSGLEPLANVVITGGTITNVTANVVSISNATITGGTITGITDLAVADGGTGASTLAANNVLLGNGTSTLQTVAPSTADNVLTSNGTTWTSSALSNLSAFDKSLAASGYQKIPGGLIMQWGLSSSVAADNSLTVTYPIAFPAAARTVQITGNSGLAAAGAGIQTVSNVTTTTFIIRNGQDTAMSFYWLAIGY